MHEQFPVPYCDFLFRVLPGWMDICKPERYGKGATCRIGVPYPEDYDEKRDGLGNKDGWAFNCYV